VTHRPLHTLALALLTVTLISAGPGDKSPKKSKSAKKSARKLKETVKRLPLDQARQRARLLHDLYETTLLTMHRHYFKPDKKQSIPSHAMEDIFYRINRRWNVKARWLVVSAQAMNIDHQPQNVFEKTAARLLGSGKTKEYEEIKDGTYRRAGPIILFASCIRCHMSQRRNPVAGLVLSLPIKPD
jgi:hypothetical protein